MCGIAGVVEFAGRDGRFVVSRASEVLAHRGPDDERFWSSRSEAASVALGHRRLSILDLSSAGSQPMLQLEDGSFRPARNADEAARLALVYNGEIYNYVELREELRNAGHWFRSDGDTEVLLAAYAQWGEECLDRLNGMFAFAIWDRDRQLLFCARDRFGEKPLYYALDQRGEWFAFASEVKALIAMGAASAEPNARSVYRFFRFGEQAGVEDTLWRDVRKLLPGMSLRVNVSGRRFSTQWRRYWDVAIADNPPVDDGKVPGRFAELFRESVSLRLRSDVPVGTSLSGGLDSSSVLCQIDALGAAAGQKAFTARMDDPALDEGKHVDLVLARTGVPGFSVVPTAREFLDELDTLAYHQEEPFSSTSVFASFLVQRLAKQHDVTVMLDGQGADEYLAGYAHYPALLLSSLARAGQWRAWWRERVATRRVIGVDPIPPRAALHYRLGALRSENGSGVQMVVETERNASFISPDLERQFSGEGPRTIHLDGDALKVRLYADLMHGHLQELLRYADRNSMAFSREVRLPFLDHRLVEFSLSLPVSRLFSAGRSKRVLREAMRGIVPEPILERSDKVGFATPWSQWWRDAGIAAAFTHRLEEARSVVSDYVNVDSVPPGSAGALGVLTLASSLRQLRSLERQASAVA